MPAVSTVNTSLLSTQHLEDRVKEIKNGDFKELLESLMQKPIEEMKELYNNREIEK